MTNEQKIHRIAKLYQRAYDSTEYFCADAGSTGSDLVGQTLYLIGAIAKDGGVELTENDPFLKDLKGMFMPDDPIWEHVEVVKS